MSSFSDSSVCSDTRSSDEVKFDCGSCTVCSSTSSSCTSGEVGIVSCGWDSGDCLDMNDSQGDLYVASDESEEIPGDAVVV